jgi:aryl-alcohol dehydrogenase-like predicted oxidoreductase
MSGLPTRPFGRAGEPVSILALGGGHIGRATLDPDEAVRIMHRAIDEGLTFFDNAWEYNDRESERRMGIAIHDRRDRVFLMTKVCARDRDGAERQLDESLASLRTDHLDLWMFHEVNYGNDPDWIFGPAGAAEAAERALRAGKVRHVGFTGHKDPNFLIRMLRYDFPWSALLMPVNCLDTGFHKSFIREVLPVAREKHASVLGMKSLGGIGQFVTAAGMDPAQCIRYSLSQDIASLVSGIDSMAVLEQNLGVARSFRAMPEAEQRALEARYKSIAGDGRFEWFKTTQFFDSREHRDQHSFPEVTTIHGR